MWPAGHPLPRSGVEHLNISVLEASVCQGFVLSLTMSVAAISLCDRLTFCFALHMLLKVSICDSFIVHDFRLKECSWLKILFSLCNW